MNSTFLLLRPAKTEEISPSAQVGLISSFLNIGKRSLVDSLLLKPHKYLSFEIANFEQKTRFYLYPPEELKGYFVSQVLSHYPKTLVTDEKTDPLYAVVKGKTSSVASLQLVHTYHYPFKTYKQFTDMPPLTALLGFLSRLKDNEAAFIQFLLRVPGSQTAEQQKLRSAMKVAGSEGKEEANPFSKLIQEKLTAPLVQCQLRLVFSTSQKEETRSRLAELAGSFGIYTLSEGNSFKFQVANGMTKRPLFNKIAERKFYFMEPKTLLNLDEVSSLWHLPDKKFEKIKAIHWGKTYLSEAPDNLPVAEEMKTDEEKKEVNFFAKTEWHNHDAIFGLSREDRTKHVYVIGKTGAGKSTLIANMAINDIRNGEGVAVIDPHGDLSEMILEYIPKRRMQDVVYLDPTLDDGRAFALNLFDKEAAEHTDVIASGIVSVFYKLYHDSWGPRLEYILRNTILTMLYYGDGTFADIPRLLSQPKFRAQVVAKIALKDTILAEFWNNEYEKMTEKLRIEAISPIQNKVGQFLSSLRIRHIVSSQHSTFSLDDIMNNGKILILNLSQGKLGEDTTALLGAMFITKMQLTAMRRVGMNKDKRKDFYLYVDEFQNFATGSFIKILSEARKYRLNLVLANQYIGQVEEDIQKAIFGNIGTMITFVIGASDAELIQHEFGGKFTANDLVALGKFQTLLKMSIGGLTSDPFFANTLPLPKVINANKDKIIRLSLEKYYRKI
ncbi:MAG: type IV secretion system DNA-binding domain-containing protein [Patescibacteria group bacterium]|jgi:hypothetical protein